MGNILGDFIAATGNKLGLPELGISEKFGSTGPVAGTPQGDIVNGIVNGPGTSSSSSSTQQVSNPVTTAPTSTATADAATIAARAKAAQTAAAIAATQQAIDSLGTEQNVGNKNIDDSFGSVIGGYDAEAQRNKADYDESSVTNNTNLQKNKQNALVAAAQGRRGLRSTLAAMGALGGDGTVLADRAVTDSANDDIGEAADTFSTNQVGLDKAIRNFEDEDKQRRAEAETSRNNSKTALEGSILTKRQAALQKMADLYSDSGNTGKAAELLGQAGGLNDAIAQRSAVAATPIAARSAAYTPGDLDSYLAGAGDMTVDVSAGGNGGATGTDTNTLLAARAKDKDKKATLVTA